jgi:hypothetical protein
VDFRPYCLEDYTPDYIYNQFRGFNAMNYYLDWLKMGNNRREAEDNDEGIGLLLQHIKDLCGCPEFYEYFLDMLAFKIQFPSTKIILLVSSSPYKVREKTVSLIGSVMKCSGQNTT